jgi:Ca2+-binding RTX toxin-like protein
MAYVLVESEFVIGSADADTLDASAWTAPALLAGGTGNDTYILWNDTQNVGEELTGGIDTVLILSEGYALGANVENLAVAANYYEFGSGGFWLTGNELANTITGADAIRDPEYGEYLSNGDDIINGGLGADRMVGGTGADTYYVDNIGDVVVESAVTPAGIGPLGVGGEIYSQIYYDVVISQVSYTLAANVEDLALEEGSAATTGAGNASANQIDGNERNNTLSGLGGDDQLVGQDGDDKLDGGDGNDRLYGDDLSPGGTPAGGVSYNDTLTGGAGSDELHGGFGKDALTGGAGNDTYFLDDESDVATKTVDTVTEAAGGGDDSVFAGHSQYVLPLNVENLFYSGSGDFAGTGNAGNNRLQGGEGDDTLTGLGGNDTLVGGGGGDTLVGGTGGDAYRGYAGRPRRGRPTRTTTQRRSATGQRR